VEQAEGICGCEALNAGVGEGEGNQWQKGEGNWEVVEAGVEQRCFWEAEVRVSEQKSGHVLQQHWGWVNIQRPFQDLESGVAVA
jgi:hypothetical protein